MSAAPAVHVYPLPETFNSALMPGHMGFERMYEVEHRIHHNLLRSTVPAEDAHLFFVPACADTPWALRAVRTSTRCALATGGP